MKSPLNFKNESSGGAYGTHASSNNGGARQRRNPADYGPFSSPHASFEEPTAFPPYSELPFTSLKRRRQFQDNNTIVKWAMRAVLLSPVVVLVLWSIAAVVFAGNHQIGHSTTKNNNNYRNRQQSQRNRQMTPNYYGNDQNPVAMNGIPQQQLQDQHGNLIYNVNGNAMMMAPPQTQQQLQSMTNGQVVTNNIQLNNGLQQQLQQQQMGAIPMQPQGKPIPMLAPLGNTMNANIIASNSLQGTQQQMLQQGFQQGGAAVAAQPQQAFMATNGAVAAQASGMMQQQEMSQMNLDSSAANAIKQPSTAMATATINDKLQQLPLDTLENDKVAQPQAAMQQASDSSGATQGQLQESPSKQAIYFYDPNQTRMSAAGEILDMPTLVYDGYGNAVPLDELRYQAPIYVQSPLLGATSDSNKIDAAGISDIEGVKILESPSARGAFLLSTSSREASLSMPKSWGASNAQDQTIIIATVAVMTLIVGALSAKRLRSTGFLSACIENESLEDDIAYDDAYTTTAGASGAMGADSSYNTFGGWKGDLEKFDV